MEDLTQLTELAHKIKGRFGVRFDASGVKKVDAYIESTRKTLPPEDREGVIGALGAFLGQCLIENYGGKWVRDANGNVAVEFRDNNLAFPFSKVAKQYDNGPEDSIYSLFFAVPKVFNLPESKKKKWWRF